jgi:uncharacterized protein (UPF0332 family)
MPCTPQALLQVATDILDRAADVPSLDRRETLYRSAVSRAYYAAYHAAEPIAIKHRYQPKKTAKGKPRGYSHSLMWDHFRKSMKDRLSFTEGTNLLARRRRADYDLQGRFYFTEALARAAISDAQSLVSDLTTKYP